MCFRGYRVQQMRDHEADRSRFGLQGNTCAGETSLGGDVGAAYLHAVRAPYGHNIVLCCSGQ